MAMVRGAAELKNVCGSGSCEIKDQAGAIFLSTPLLAETRCELSRPFVVESDSEAVCGVFTVEGLADSDVASEESSSSVVEPGSPSTVIFRVVDFFADEMPGSFFFRSFELVGRSDSLDSAADSSSSAFGSDSFNCASAVLEMQRRNSSIENSDL